MQKALITTLGILAGILLLRTIVNTYEPILAVTYLTGTVFLLIITRLLHPVLPLSFITKVTVTSLIMGLSGHLAFISVSYGLYHHQLDHAMRYFIPCSTVTILCGVTIYLIKTPTKPLIAGGYNDPHRIS